jgi:hypothetical protein
MNKNRRLPKAIRRLPLAGAAAAAVFLLHSCGRAEAGPQPDPAEVQRFLARMDAEQFAAGEAQRKKGHEKRIKNLVEGAMTRAPSDSVINKLETVVVG